MLQKGGSYDFTANNIKSMQQDLLQNYAEKSLDNETFNIRPINNGYL